jgi:T-complex protein 1 subunit zeta
MTLSLLNPKAEFAKASHARAINISAAKGLQEILKTNLGPKGTLKMLVSGAGELKITKDGFVLLQEMQIQHPTASLLARCATAQDDSTGDGTTSNILINAELLRQADLYIEEGLHPRILVDSYELAKIHVLELLPKLAHIKTGFNREILQAVARTSLRTKLHHELADKMTTHIVDAVEAIYNKGEPLDMHRIEIMEMAHKSDLDSTLVKGLVLDHGGRHPDMPKRVTNAYIFTCNISLEYEKTEVNSSFFYKSAEEREKLVAAERAHIDGHVQKIIALKKQVCGAGKNTEKSFVLINQKGIDPLSLDALAREGIIGLRRAKRRNMERLALSCGGQAMNSPEGLTPDCLGQAGLVYEYTLGEEKYTFVEECKNPRSVTLLIRGPNKHTIVQIKDAIKDGLRAVKNALEDQAVLPGAGAFEIAANRSLKAYSETLSGLRRLGIMAFAEAMLIIPKTLAVNAGHDGQETLVKLQEESVKMCKNVSDFTSKNIVGVDLSTGGPCLPGENGIWDNVRVKAQVMSGAAEIATQILLVDEMMRAGLSSLKG